MLNSVSLTHTNCDCGCGCNDGCGCVGGCQNSCGCGMGCGCGCNNGCGNCGCLNGCNPCGCLNGCNSCGCVGGCNSCGCGLNFGCHCGCSTGCGCSDCGCDCGCDDDCGCGNSCGCNRLCRCLFPDAPALASGGTLAPRIVASGRACLRANDLRLCVEDLPDCAQPPFALVCVTASGPSEWEFLSIEYRRAVLRVTIPLSVQIRDCAGCLLTGHASITVDVPVCITIPQRHPARARVEVLPMVRLLCVDGCSEDGCFTVNLAVLVDVYVTRWELGGNGITVPCRPDLPLNLPPHFHRCCR